MSIQDRANQGKIIAKYHFLVKKGKGSGVRLNKEIENQYVI
jgi:hypothetical protein